MYYLKYYKYSQYLVGIFYMRFLNLLIVTYVYIKNENISIIILLFFTLINVKKCISQI